MAYAILLSGCQPNSDLLMMMSLEAHLTRYRLLYVHILLYSAAYVSSFESVTTPRVVIGALSAVFRNEAIFVIFAASYSFNFVYWNIDTFLA